MANIISSMKLTNPIKEMVSKSKKRYTDDGYNLDLSCTYKLHANETKEKSVPHTRHDTYEYTK